MARRRIGHEEIAAGLVRSPVGQPGILIRPSVRPSVRFVPKPRWSHTVGVGP